MLTQEKKYAKKRHENNKRQYNKIAKMFPVQHGNVTYSNLQVLNAMLYVLENGGKWRQLPKQYGKWNSLYKPVNRWAKNGVLVRIFAFLHAEQITNLSIDVLCLDSTILKVHPHGCGAAKKRKTIHRKISWRLDYKITYAGCQ